MKNGKNRITLALVAAGFVLVGTSAYFLSSGNSQQEEVQAQGNVVVSSNIQSVNSIPGQSNDAEHNKLQEKANELNYEKSKQNSENFIPKLVNNVEEEKTFELPKEEPKPEPEPVIEEKIPEPAPVQEELPKEEPKPEPVVKKEIKPVIVNEIKETPKEEVDQNLVQLYATEMQSLYALWAKNDEDAKKDLMASEQDYFSKGVSLEKISNTQSVTGDGNGTLNANSKATNNNVKTQTGPVFVRAATIVPGEMLTSVNTDEPGPVLARITSGPLKGARLLGQVVNAPTSVTDRVQKATIQFTQLQMSGSGGTYSIDVYAVDPNTSRTAVASSVDNHYFLRYGLGMAAAFIQGMGEGFANANKTVTYAGDGVVLEQSASDSKQIARGALGNAGKKFGSELEKISNVPATIYVEAGTPLGLLFMSDF